ncbi:MAG: hypothetical protein RL839_01945 [Gammaproteobacteria bacterium]
MPDYYYLLAFFATILATATLRPVAGKIGLLDIPGGRKTHIGATPLVGGLGIFIGLLSISIISVDVINAYAPLLSLSALIVFIGVIDDIKDLRVIVRMTGHTLVAIAMAIVAGIQLESFGNILLGEEIALNSFALPVTVFATVGVINAINMSDGIDGLSGTLVVVALICIGIVAGSKADFVTVSFIALLSACILAFLTMNFRRPWNQKALVYLGDAGSTMLGFMLAWLLIESSQGEHALFPPVYALWFLAVPLFDTVNLLIKRPIHGFSPFKPGVDHLHHALLRRGFTVQQVVLILAASSLALAGIGLTGYFWQASDSVMFQLFLGLFLLYFLFCDRLDPQHQH